jgi:hypothetical protein
MVALNFSRGLLKVSESGGTCLDGTVWVRNGQERGGRPGEAARLPRIARATPAQAGRSAPRRTGRGHIGAAASIGQTRSMAQTMDLVIGPLIERDGSYGYDTFTPREGLRPSFRYRVLEEARYDRRAMIAESQHDPRLTVHVCETQGEFEERVATAGRDGADPPPG